MPDLLLIFESMADSIGLDVAVLGVLAMLIAWAAIYLLCARAGAGSRAWVMSAVPMLPICLLLQGIGVVSVEVSMMIIVTLVVAVAVHVRGIISGDDRDGDRRHRSDNN